MRVEYEIPVLYDWGNWLSIRCEPGPVLDLSAFNGLELKLKNEVPSGAILRVTLADVSDASMRAEDELWWFDLDPEVLAASTGEWQTLRLPFKGFRLSYGEGARHNDGRLDVSKIVAYEVNMVSPRKTSAKGTVVLDSLVAY